MHLLKKTFAMAMLFSLLAQPLAAQAWVKNRTYKFTVLHTNDHHGHFWYNAQGEYGFPAQKTLIDNIRYDVQMHGGQVLVLSGGDVNTGVPASDLLHAEPDFRGMNLIGYDAMAIGNHEFDNPLSVLRQQQKWAKFPLLSANIYQKSSGKRLFQPYALFNRMGLKIAVIGLTTEDTAKIGNPEYLRDVAFHNPTEEVRSVIASLHQKEKPDVIIAATHMGHYDNAAAASNAPGDVTLARSLPAGWLNVIVGGHTHTPLCMTKENTTQSDWQPGMICTPDRQNGTWIMQAGEWGKYVGRADFTFLNGVLTLRHYELIPVNLRRNVTDKQGNTHPINDQVIANNPAMMKLLMPFKRKSEAQLKMKIGRIDQTLSGERRQVRFRQSALARLILSGMMAQTQADFAVISGGGIRDSLPAGEISYNDVLKVQPFDNRLVYVTMKGSEVINYLAAVANIQPGTGGYAQFAKVSLLADGHGVSDVKINGQPLEMDKTYRMATLSFYAAGGDGYPLLAQHAGYVNTGMVAYDVLKKYISAHSPLKAQDYMPQDDIRYQPKEKEEEVTQREKPQPSLASRLTAWFETK